MKYHMLYKQEGDEIYSRGVTVEAIDILTAIKLFNQGYKGKIIAVYDIDSVSQLLNVQKDMASIPNPPSRSEISSHHHKASSNENTQNQQGLSQKD